MKHSSKQLIPNWNLVCFLSPCLEMTQMGEQSTSSTRLPSFWSFPIRGNARWGLIRNTVSSEPHSEVWICKLPEPVWSNPARCATARGDEPVSSLRRHGRMCGQQHLLVKALNQISSWQHEPPSSSWQSRADLWPPENETPVSSVFLLVWTHLLKKKKKVEEAKITLFSWDYSDGVLFCLNSENLNFVKLPVIRFETKCVRLNLGEMVKTAKQDFFLPELQINSVKSYDMNE